MELAGASPLGLLRSAPGARGFWARGERWVAHAGVVASVEAEPGPDRFAEVRRATAIATPEPGPSWPAGADPRLTGRPRFFGGFSFQDEPGPSHLWVGFPPALFHLPAIELEGDAEGIARLHVRALARDGEPEAALRERLEERMRELAARLRAPEDEAPEAGSTGAAGRSSARTRVTAGRGTWPSSAPSMRSGGDGYARSCSRAPSTFRIPSSIRSRCSRSCGGRTGTRTATSSTSSRDPDG